MSTGLVDARASEEEEPAVKFSNVSKAYRLYATPQARLLSQMGLGFTLPKDKRGYSLFHALHDVNFEIAHGERVGLVGRNGAGKTTLLKLITENFAPTEGEIAVTGSVQALMQLGLGFHPEFSGFENIRSSLSYNGLTGDDLEEAIEDVVDFVELGNFLHQPLKTYSLGMNARLQFAAATAIRPDILLIDEVLSAGDSYFSAKSAFRMEKLAKSGCTVILVSHSWQQIQQYCKRAIWLKDGRVHMDGLTHEVMAEYEVEIAEDTERQRATTWTRGVIGQSDEDDAETALLPDASDEATVVNILESDAGSEKEEAMAADAEASPAETEAITADEPVAEETEDPTTFGR